MDAMRYWWVSGRDHFATPPVDRDQAMLDRLRQGLGGGFSGQPGSWMR